MKTIIYGAYGFTGRLIAREAVRRGMRPMLAGRDLDKLKALADDLKLPFMRVGLSDREALVTALKDADAVLHCAGPFVKTVTSMVAACLHTRTHYLDITGEVAVLEALMSLSERAAERGVMLLPAVGMDVAPTDVIAVKLHELMPDAAHLDLAVKSTGTLTRGTLRTMLGQIDEGSVVREEGKLKSIRIGSRTRKMLFEEGLERVANVPLGDAVTAYHSTGIPNITTYMRFPSTSPTGIRLSGAVSRFAAIPSVRRFLTSQIERIPEGPSEAIAETARIYAAGEAIRIQLPGPDSGLRMVTGHAELI